MKKGWSIALLIVGILILAALVANLLNGGIWIIEGLNGKDGVNGTNGLDGQNGTNGLDGQNGKSAYELAVEDGFEGSLHEWLLSLAVRGQDGNDGTPGKPGNTGAAGVGVQDVRVNSEGHLIVTLTDGTVLDAGKVSADLSQLPDEMGFYEVYEMVVQTGKERLNLRFVPDINGPDEDIYVSIPAGTVLLRTGDQRVEGGYSRFLYNDRVCYAKSHHFELKYDYNAEIPSYSLPDRMVLIKDRETWLDLGQIMPSIPSNVRLTFAYSGKGETVLQAGKGWSLTPTATGEETITVTISKNENGAWTTVAVEEIQTVVVDASAALPLTGLMLGDSRIAGGDLLNAITDAMPDLELIGTRTRNGILHEGRGAWATKHYLECLSSDVSGVDTKNAFFNPDTNRFDFTYYMNKYEQENGFDPQTLDFVVIHLGANDNWSRESVDNINTMIASIHAYSPEIKILVMTEYLSPADGYYLNGGRDVESMRRRQLAYFTYQTEVFGDREDEQIYLLPNYISINDLSDWPTTTVNVDGKETVVVNDPQLVHLGERGYGKEAATVEAWLYWLFANGQ